MTTRAMEPDLELLGAVRWMVREELDQECAEYGGIEGDEWDRVYGGVPIDPDRARLILEGEEDPTLTELSHLLASVGIGWSEFGRRLRAWQRSRAQSDGPPQYEAVRWDVREEAMVQRIEGLMDQKLEPIIRRLRRLEQEGDDAADDQGQ